MILEDKKIIFVHAPRTSGTSIEKSVLNGGMVPDHQKHLRASFFKSALGDEWNKYFKFTIVRNPWDRVVSLYHQVFHANYGIRTGKSLDFFLENYRPAPWEYGIQCSDYADEEMDLVIKMEDRERGLKELNEKTGLNIDADLKERVRPRKLKSYKDYYDPSTEQKVRDIFARDISLYDYEF